MYGSVYSQRFNWAVQIVHIVHALQKRPQHFAKMFSVVDNVDNIKANSPHCPQNIMQHNYYLDYVDNAQIIKA